MGNSIRIRRTQQGLKQQALANMTGVSQGEISQIENGAYEPGVFLALRLAKALSAKVDELFWED